MSFRISRRELLATGAAFGGSLALPSYLRAQSSLTEISAQYQAPVVFDALMQELARAFEATHPNIKITYRAPEVGYPELLQRNLRDAITNTLPDVAFHGLNRQRALVDRNLPVDLKPFLDSDPAVTELGYTPELLSVGQVSGVQSGIAFGMSKPVFYYNGDLVKAAGGDPDNLPTTWDELIELASAIHDPTKNVTGMFYRWNAANDWGWQALVRSHGGTFLDETGTKVRFTEDPGRAGTRLLQRFAVEAQMPDLSTEVLFQEMFSGRLGILHTSSAELGRMQREIGDRFQLLGGAYPVAAEKGRIPAGGQVVVMFTKDQAKQQAAWEFIKFVTGPVGATMMVKAVGYMPSTVIPAEREDMLAPVYRGSPLQRLGVEHPEQLTGWFEWPGPNGVKITDTIVDRLYPIIVKTSDADSALDGLGTAVQALLPEA